MRACVRRVFSFRGRVRRRALSFFSPKKAQTHPVLVDARLADGAGPAVALHLHPPVEVEGRGWTGFGACEEKESERNEEKKRTWPPVVSSVHPTRTGTGTASSTGGRTGSPRAPGPRRNRRCSQRRRPCRRRRRRRRGRNSRPARPRQRRRAGPCLPWPRRQGSRPALRAPRPRCRGHHHPGRGARATRRPCGRAAARAGSLASAPAPATRREAAAP
jgi:hypothetical protein